MRSTAHAVKIFVFGLLVSLLNGVVTGAEVRLVPHDAEDDDYFGEAVGISGDDVIVGAPFDDDLGGSSGSAYIFRFDGVSWIENDKLHAVEGESGDRFGVVVAIDDGWAVIGASYEDEGGTSAGAAYVFHDDGGEWNQHAKLLAGDPGSYDHFGYAVGISGDTVIVGVPDSDEPEGGTGSAYIFVREGGLWVQQAKLLANDADGGDNFGFAVAVSGDNAVVGAPYDDDACDPPNSMCQSGSIYVFTRSGSIWSQQTKLVASADEAGDLFGYAVAIEGGRVFVGSPRDDDAANDAGAAYVFGDGWAELDILTAQGGAVSDELGRSVGFSGSIALIGAPLDDAISNACGVVVTFVGSAPWIEVGEETADDGAGHHEFGNAVDIDGSWAVVGASHFDYGMGAAYVYHADDLMPEWLLFVDGFETGDTDAWSGEVGD